MQISVTSFGVHILGYQDIIREIKILEENHKSLL